MRHVRGAGTCRHRSGEECATATHLAFPYRGAYLQHVGSNRSVADANHVLFFNAGESYQVSHPVLGSDASLVIALSEPLLRELTPPDPLHPREAPGFRLQSRGIDPAAQAMVALLRHRLQHGQAETLEAESLLLHLVGHVLGPRTPQASNGVTPARRRLVDRIKLLSAGDRHRRWTLAEIGDEIGASAVYLTQAFKQVEGLPLYRYQLQLARALELIAACDDVSALAHERGFSSHSHFTAAFRRAYRRSPSDFRRAATPPEVAKVFDSTG